MFTRFLLLISLIGFGLSVHCADLPFEFKQAGQQQRYQQLIGEIRCLVCQNQTLTDSHADLAQDLRQEVYQMIIAGKQNQDIINFLVERYGDFVLYRPPLNPSTWVLWFAPFVLLLLAIVFIVYFIRRLPQASVQQLNQQEQEKLSRLFDDNMADK